MPDDIAERLALIRETIKINAQKSSRDPEQITLVAVSKQQPAAKIEQAIQAGQLVFAENRVQEAKNKWSPLLERYPEVRLHLIGPLQTNKVRESLRWFDVIETLDRVRLVETLAREMPLQGRFPKLWIEVNTGAEKQKGGVYPQHLAEFLELCRQHYGLSIEGLMAIPPLDEEPALHFALLGQLAERNGCQGLSMGMSTDYPLAVRLGATEVRVGTALFGSRQDS